MLVTKLKKQNKLSCFKTEYKSLNLNHNIKRRRKKKVYAYVGIVSGSSLILYNLMVHEFEWSMVIHVPKN